VLQNPEVIVRIYIGFDDTDNKDAPIGTGRLVRQFIYGLPDKCSVVGVVRHQLPRLSDIPFTSNNSSACAIVEMDDTADYDWLAERAVKHILHHCAPGSDPGLCIAEESKLEDRMVVFGQKVTSIRVTQQDAMLATTGLKLEGLGGTNDGIIGAAAAVGLTKFGWCGRFIEYGRLRDLERDIQVQDLLNENISVISIDRDPLVPQPADRIINAQWIRPSLWGGKPMLQLRQVEHGVWEPAHSKRKKDKKAQPGMMHGQHQGTATPYIS